MSLLLEQKHRRPIFFKKGYLLVIFLLLLLVIALFIGFQTVQNALNAPESKDPFKTAGYIFANLPTERGSVFTYYDLSTKLPKQYDRPYFYMPVENKNEDMLLASGIVTDDTGKSYSGIISLKNGASADDIIYASSSVKVVFQEPQLSSQGDSYLFVIGPEDSKKTSLPEAWNIYLGSITNGHPTLIAKGTHARFSPDGKSVIYLANDGLHLYDRDTHVSKLVLPLTNQSKTATADMMIAISRDGTRLAFSDPEASKLHMLQIASWNVSDFETTDIVESNVIAFWPVFSPDGSQIAFEQADWNVNQDNLMEATHARLSVIDLTTSIPSLKQIADWNMFDASKITVSDWVTTD